MAVTMKPRTTIYKGVTMRSRLEAGFARWLDEVGAPWEYEPCAFAADDGWQYLPDFRLTGALDGVKSDRIFAEVKPSTWMPERRPETARFLARAQGALSANDAGLLLLAYDHPGYGGLLYYSIDAEHLQPLGVGVGPGLNLYPTVGDRPWRGEWWKGVS